MPLTREQLLRPGTPTTEEVTVPGETEKALVRSLTSAEVIAFGKEYGNSGYGDFPLLLWGVIDQSGASILTKDDLPAIMGAGAYRWMPVVAAINRLTGFTVTPKASASSS